MKRILTLIAIAVGLMLPMQAQQPIKAFKNKNGIERKMMRKATAADITVNDLLGTYSASAYSAFDESQETWTLTITADADNENKVWIHPICMIEGATAEDLKPIYATFDAAQGTLTMPLGQVIEEVSGQYKLITATSTDGQNKNTTGNVTISINNSASGLTLTFAENEVFGIGDILNGNWWYQGLFYITFTKTGKIENDPYVYIYNKGVSSPTRVKASQLYFNLVEGDMCVTTKEKYRTEGVAGVYKAYAESAIDYSREQWTVTITVDETDANKVWIYPFCQFGGLPEEYINPIYAIYDEDAATLSIPMGQILYEEPDFRMIVGSTTDFENVNTTEPIEATITEEGILIDHIVGVGNAIGDEWWYQALLGIIYEADRGEAYPLVDIEKITRATPEVQEGFTFVTPGNYGWYFQVQSSETDFVDLASGVSFSAGDAFDLTELFGEQAAGVTARNWEISGFLSDIGFFDDGGQAYDMPAFSYSMTDQYGLFEVMCMVDKQNGLCPIGSVLLPDEEGNQYKVDILLGDLADNNVSYAAFIAEEENLLQFAGDQGVLWYIFENQAYLYAYVNNMAIEKIDANGAPMRVKAEVSKKASIIGQGTPLKIGKRTEMVRK